MARTCMPTQYGTELAAEPWYSILELKQRFQQAWQLQYI